MDYDTPLTQPRCTLVFTGNGHGATLYHLGSLWCLNELGWLGRCDRVISASGGALLAAHLGLQWRALVFDARGRADNFVELIVRPILDAFDHLPALGADMLSLARDLGRKQMLALCQCLLGRAALEDLPDAGSGPDFAFYSRSHPDGNPVRIDRQGLTEEGLGRLLAPYLPMSFAVLAASAHAPAFIPERLEFDNSRWQAAPGVASGHESRHRSAMLFTGGYLRGEEQLDTLPAATGQTFVSDAGGRYGFNVSRPATERRQREQAPPPPVPPADFVERHGRMTLNETLRAYWSMAGDIQPARDAPAQSDILLPEDLSSLTRNRRYPASRSFVDRGYSMAGKALPRRKEDLH